MRPFVAIRVRGTVQGVGFRPTVWRLARDEGLTGDVRNDADGVLIRVSGPEAAIARFVERLRHEPPPLARIETIDVRPLDSSHDGSMVATNIADIADAADAADGKNGADGEYGAAPSAEFVIVESAVGGSHTRIAPDAAACGACLREVFDPADRRHGYPFANCTHCGPRFSIVIEIPYDRARTTMSRFSMCEACRDEYENPRDRRFHAQPIACPACGPRVWLETARDESPVTATNAVPVAHDLRVMSDTRFAPDGNFTSNLELVNEVVRSLLAGRIVAIRGLGGFHLACDATNSDAVERLRSRKRRYRKPLALMARDLDVVRRYCRVSRDEAEILASVEAPIVLLDRLPRETGGMALPESLAPGVDSLGFMLPYAPLHALLMRELDRPLVMTSGNVSDEPQVTRVDEARVRLAGIADLFWMHDRDIANRIDDSVVAVTLGGPRLVRRARGYAPAAFRLPAGFDRSPEILAYGGELKATFCLVKDGAAVLSQHQGDLEDAATLADYEHNLALYGRMYDHRPEVLAVDSHPEYLATKVGRARRERDGLPLVEVQHHHAHLASCMAENGVPLDSPPLLGIALDGLGMGDDGTLWGGEFLLADYLGYRRLAAFPSIAMAGGTQAIREPWRNTYAHLVSSIGWDAFAARYSSLELYRLLANKPIGIIDRMRRGGVNSPLASSCGRLFDAVAAALGVSAERASYEGQCAAELETLATLALEHSSREIGGYACARSDGGKQTDFVTTIDRGTETDGRKEKYRGTATYNVAGDGADDGTGNGTPDLGRDHGNSASDAPRRLDVAPLWRALCDDLLAGEPNEIIAARFHVWLGQSICGMVRALEATIGGGERRFGSVVLSGGCWQNRLLLKLVVDELQGEGRRCLLHTLVPPNDGGLSLGQAVIAAARVLSS